MTKDIYIVDPDIHAMIRESLKATGLRLSDSPEGVSALVTEDRDIDEKILDAAGEKLEAIFVLDPGTAYLMTSLLEGVFARGDRRLGGVVEKAWRRGCRFDAWSEHLRFDTWRAVFASSTTNTL